jgi:hypothetical protein
MRKLKKLTIDYEITKNFLPLVQSKKKENNKFYPFLKSVKNIIMKQTIALFVAIILVGISSCTSDDDMVTPNCEVISQNIQILLENGDPPRTRIEWAGMFNDGPGVPSFDGCIINQNNRFWNLEQIISYELRDDRLILRFP